MMKINAFKQIAMTTVLLGLNSVVFAQDERIQDNLVAQQNNMAQDKKVKPASTYSPYLGDKMPPYSNPNRFLIQASFIYWQADVDGLDYALEQNLQVNSDLKVVQGTPVVATENIVYSDDMKNRGLDFKWNPGFKAGIGVVFGDMDEWDIVLNWTWLQSKAHRTRNIDTPASFNQVTEVGQSDVIISNLGDFLTPAYSAIFLGSPAVSAKNNWRMHYNTLDLELGRNFFLAKSLTMRPHIGLRGAWIHQHTKVNYELGSIGASLNPFASSTSTKETTPYFEGNLSGTSQFKGKNDYNAVGLRGGFDMRWNFTSHFCVYSTLAGAILYGQFKIDEDFDANYSITIPTVSSEGNATQITNYLGNASLDNSYHRTRTNLQAILGLLWHTGLYNDKHHLTISAGYEVNEWFQQNEIGSIEGDVVPFTLKSYRTNGDLGLHGLTVDVKYDF